MEMAERISPKACLSPTLWEFDPPVAGQRLLQLEDTIQRLQASQAASINHIEGLQQVLIGLQAEKEYFRAKVRGPICNNDNRTRNCPHTSSEWPVKGSALDNTDLSTPNDMEDSISANLSESLSPLCDRLTDASEEGVRTDIAHQNVSFSHFATPSYCALDYADMENLHFDRPFQDNCRALFDEETDRSGIETNWALANYVDYSPKLHQGADYPSCNLPNFYCSSILSASRQIRKDLSTTFAVNYYPWTSAFPTENCSSAATYISNTPNISTCALPSEQESLQSNPDHEGWSTIDHERLLSTRLSLADQQLSPPAPDFETGFNTSGPIGILDYYILAVMATLKHVSKFTHMTYVYSVLLLPTETFYADQVCLVLRKCKQL
jgi:hypothetical protein